MLLYTCIHTQINKHIYAYTYKSVNDILICMYTGLCFFKAYIYICIVVYATTRIEQIRQVAKQKGYNDPYIHV